MIDTQKNVLTDTDVDEDELLALSHCSKTEEHSLDDIDIDEDELLALSHCSGSEFDYDLDLTDSLLECDDTKPLIPPPAESLKPGAVIQNTTKIKEEIRPMKQTTRLTSCHNLFPRQTRSICDFEIDADDFKSTTDALDLQLMAERFAELERSKRNKKIVFEGAGDDFDLEALIRTDRMLQEAHNMIYKQQGQMDRETRVSLQNSILRMIYLPHLYVPMPPKKQRRIRVEDWLNNHTSNPEPEMCGFIEKDPVQPRKFVPEVQPRLSASVTEVVGKRKRGFDSMEGYSDGAIKKSSSDTRLKVHADCSRPCLSGKRRKTGIR